MGLEVMHEPTVVAPPDGNPAVVMAAGDERASGENARVLTLARFSREIDTSSPVFWIQTRIYARHE